MGNKNSSKNPKGSGEESSKFFKIIRTLFTSDSSSMIKPMVTPKAFEQAVSGHSSTNNYRITSTYLPEDSKNRLTSNYLNDASQVASIYNQEISTTLTSRNVVDDSRRSSTLSEANRVTDFSSQRMSATLTLRNACDVSYKSLTTDQTLMPKPWSAENELVRPDNVPIPSQHSVQTVPKPNLENNYSKKTFELTPFSPQSSSCSPSLQNSHSANYTMYKEKVELNSTSTNLRSLSYANRNSSNIDNDVTYIELMNELTIANNSTMHHSYGNQSNQSKADLRMLTLLDSKLNLPNVSESDYSTNNRGKPRRRRRKNNIRQRQGNKRGNKIENGSSFDRFNDNNNIYPVDNARQSNNVSNNGQQNRRGVNVYQFPGRGRSRQSSNIQKGANRVSKNNRGGRRETALTKFDKASRDELMHAKQPSSNFRQVATVLCLEDVHQMADTFLKSNIVKGCYNDVEHYLDVHFRLLREDFVALLRDGIIEYISLLRRNEGKDIKLQDLKIYNNVNLFMMDKIPFVGIIHIIKFDVSKLKGIKWEQTKLFLNGSLVCLSSDGFQNFQLAIIVKRDPAQLSKGYVGIKFLQNEILEIDVNDNFVMVENPAYFEAYHAVLEGFKNIVEDTMPFVKNIVNADKDINPPAYLNQSSQYDLTCIARDDAVWKHCYPLISTSWPTINDLKLNESQCKALKAVLTKEIAVIQGPPGTGKTFLGLSFVQVLLSNKKAWSVNGNSPILIVCYTNHALDQFLEKIKVFSNGIVRVGGSSKSEELKTLNINNLRRKMQKNHKVPDDVRNSRKELRRELLSIANEIENYLVELRKGVETVLSETTLALQCIISKEHLMQLIQLKTENCGHAPTKSTAIKIWLGLDGISFNDNPQQQLRNFIENLKLDAKLEDQDVNDSDVENNWKTNDSWVANSKQIHKNTKTAIKVEEHEDPFNKFQITKDEKKRLKQKIKAELIKSDYMRETEVVKINNVVELHINERWSLYRYWIKKFKDSKLKELEKLQIKNEICNKQLKEVNEYFDIEILKNATIIGMTTTGAAKHRSILQQVQPAIVIVEEAAEVLEAHIITALSKGCKHLVLIGDQQQLKPNPTVYKLAKDYNLDISLFERLINNGLPYERLTSQHRMRPEISTLLIPHIYQDLQNNPDVEKYENIGGMRKNVFFLNHRNNEASVEDSKSKTNAFEAGMIIALASYLLLQGYLTSQVTILSTYLGQVDLIKKLMENTIVKDVHCTAVDNFQGEENDIILLSLVRSNDEGIVGFLKVENRVCVALSRARKGLFCIGNFNLLGSKAPIWKPIIKKLLDNNAIGHGFPLICQNHPTTTFDARRVKDFEKVPEGGCLLPCEYRLQCGHLCEKVCHIINKEHTQIKCLKPCSKIVCSKGHKCLKICSEPCGRCTAEIEKWSPCGHLNTMPCHMDPMDHSCTQPCNAFLPCNHQCVGYCGSMCDHTKCNVLVRANYPCGHTEVITCNLLKNDKALLKTCKNQCETLLYNSLY